MPVQQYVCLICDLYCDLCESVAETKLGAVKLQNWMENQQKHKILRGNVNQKCKLCSSSCFDCIKNVTYVWFGSLCKLTLITAKPSYYTWMIIIICLCYNTCCCFVVAVVCVRCGCYVLCFPCNSLVCKLFAFFFVLEILLLLYLLTSVLTPVLTSVLTPVLLCNVMSLSVDKKSCPSRMW